MFTGFCDPGDTTDMFACTACIDIDFEYRFPFTIWVYPIVLCWFGSNVWRNTEESPKLRRVLIFIGILLATAWFDLCMIPLAWGGLLGLVTFISAVLAILRPTTGRTRKWLAGTVVILLLALAVLSIGTAKGVAHQIAWLGRLPTHSIENRLPVHKVRSQGNEMSRLLIQTAELEVSDHSVRSRNRMAALAREISRLPNPPCPVLLQYWDRAVEETNEGMAVGMSTVILACGQAAKCDLSESIEKQLIHSVSQEDDYATLVFLTALGLQDRDAALEWAGRHDMPPIESAHSYSRQEDAALHELWAGVKSGNLTPANIQAQLDRLTPACGP